MLYRFNMKDKIQQGNFLLKKNKYMCLGSDFNIWKNWENRFFSTIKIV